MSLSEEPSPPRTLRQIVQDAMSQVEEETTAVSAKAAQVAHSQVAQQPPSSSAQQVGFPAGPIRVDDEANVGSDADHQVLTDSEAEKLVAIIRLKADEKCKS